MLANFVAGGAAISVLARTLGLPLYVVDAGTLATAPMVGVHVDKPRCGTADFSLEPAMSTSDLDHALAAGRRAIERWALGADLVILGEMGIGNSTAAAAVAAALLGREGHEVAGAGTGLDAQGVVRKAALVTSALARHGLARRAGGAVSADVSRILATVGGLEIAALAGAIVRAGQAGVPVLVDGFIVTVAALAAVRLQPSVSPWLIFSHRSAEQGHAAVLDALGAQPVVALGLRLGEASGAASVLPLVRLACALHAEMATFEAAGIAGPVA